MCATHAWSHKITTVDKMAWQLSFYTLWWLFALIAWWVSSLHLTLQVHVWLNHFMRLSNVDLTLYTFGNIEVVKATKVWKYGNIEWHTRSCIWDTKRDQFIHEYMLQFIRIRELGSYEVKCSSLVTKFADITWESTIVLRFATCRARWV